LYFAPFSGATKAGCTPPVAPLFGPEEEWLSRRSHHTAQRTVPFWTDNAETPVPRVHPDCRPSARDPPPQRSPLQLRERPASLFEGTAHLFMFKVLPSSSAFSTHTIRNSSPSSSKLHILFTSSSQVPATLPQGLTSSNYSRSSFD
jgi:hypothetical protein